MLRASFPSLLNLLSCRDQSVQVRSQEGWRAAEEWNLARPGSENMLFSLQPSKVQAWCRSSGGRGWAPILLPVPPHLSVSGNLASGECVCPQQAAPCRWSSARLPSGFTVPSFSPAFSLSSGQPLSCLLLQSSLSGRSSSPKLLSATA